MTNFAAPVAAAQIEQLANNARKTAAYITDEQARLKYLRHITELDALAVKYAGGQSDKVKVTATLLATVAAMHEIEVSRTSYFNRTGKSRTELWADIRAQIEADKEKHRQI